MAPISQQSIDAIMNAVDIVDVVGEYVKLQPAGKNYKGLCPFHSEKTPSFFVSPEKHIFHCFGCGEKGNAAAFLQKYKNITWPEAMKELADRHGIPLELDRKYGPDESFQRYYEINSTATDFYALALTNSAEGKPALEYLLNRGLDLRTIQQFELGFAPDAADQLYRNLKGRYQELDMLQIGLIKKNAEGNYYDLFRNRVMFPIRNEYGKVVAFSGRLYRKAENEPKYVNSPFTEIFTKGETVYNLDRAQPAIKTAKRVFLYEGFMDVIASVNAGVREAVASMGTALTPAQANLLKRYADKVVLCYDGDAPGFEAMGKAIPILEEAKLEVTILLLPEGLDPDEYCRKYSPAKYRAYVEENQADKYEFAYQRLVRHADLRRPAAVEKVKLDLFDWLIRENSGTLIRTFVEKLAADLKIDVETLMSDFRAYGFTKNLKLTRAAERGKTGGVARLDRNYTAEVYLMNYYFQNVQYRNRIEAELTPYFVRDDFLKVVLLEVQDILEVHPGADLVAEIGRRMTNDRRREFDAIIVAKLEYSEKGLAECITTLKSRGFDDRIKELESEREGLAKDDPAYLAKSEEIRNLRKGRESLWKRTTS
ncbi:MAG: DNA primase [Candidatus Izemoplasmatales bacterium]